MKNIFNTKHIKKTALGLVSVSLLLASSCKKFTDLQPKDALSTVTGFSTPATIELAAAGMYNSAEVGTYNGGAGRGYPFGAASIEQSEMRGEDMVNIAAFYQITYQATYDATTANNVNMWINLYQLINQCNTFIAGIQSAASSGVIPAATEAAYEGEARFLRALAHHELLIMFAKPYLDNAGANPGVPYRTIPVNTQDAVVQATAVDRGTVKADYTAILADLDYAEANLPVTRTSALVLTRATKAAAIALKTRVKLHMGDYAGVITEGTKLGTAGAAPFTSPIGGYKLTATPDGPFANFGQTVNGESMFSIENSTKANPGVNGSLAQMLGPSATATVPSAGRNLVCTSPNLYNASFWVASDTRRSLLQVYQTVSKANYYFNNKYRDYANQTDYAPILRYAEVLLNVAEAYSRTTALSPQGLALLNAVRNRAVAAADQYTASTFATQNSLTQAILNERRIEFAGEGRRWEDISRLVTDPVFSTNGIPAKVLIGDIATDGTSYDIVKRPVIPAKFAAIPYTGAALSFKFLWPIPNSELAANPTLAAQQNPGY